MAELAVRRAAWGGPACALSLLAHGAAAALLVVLAHPAMVVAPFEPIAVALLEEPAGAEAAPPALELPTAAALPEPAPPRAQSRPPLRRTRPARVDPPPAPSEPAPIEPEPQPSTRPAIPVRPPPFLLGSAPVTAAPRPAVDPDVARALRVYDAFPSLPEQAGRGPLAMDVRVCVSTEGAVSDAVIVHGPVDPASETLRAAILRWRYRPFAPEGTPTPFCHLMRISYRMN